MVTFYGKYLPVLTLLLFFFSSLMPMARGVNPKNFPIVASDYIDQQIILDSRVHFKYYEPHKEGRSHTGMIVKVFGATKSDPLRDKLKGSGIMSADKALQEVEKELQTIDFSKLSSVVQQRIDKLAYQNDVEAMVILVTFEKTCEMHRRFPRVPVYEIQELVHTISAFEIVEVCSALARERQRIAVANGIMIGAGVVGSIIYGAACKAISDRCIKKYPYAAIVVSALGWYEIFGNFLYRRIVG